MKIVITGHTRGLGKAIYDHYISQGHEVIGLSKSNGYLLPIKINEVVKIARDCDIFFNNAHASSSQKILMKELYETTPMIVSGSIAASYYVPGSKNYVNGVDITHYFRDKFELEETFKIIKDKRKHPLLLLRMGYLENFPNKEFIPFSQIINAIEFWIKNPRATLIEFDNL